MKARLTMTNVNSTVLAMNAVKSAAEEGVKRPRVETT